MSIDLNKLIDWFNQRRGKITYSMYGSRNGSDGTSDCSGSMTTALIYAGGKATALLSTVSLPAYLASIGFKRIAVNTDWDMLRGDIILWSDGADMASSGGAGGHVMVATSGYNEISCDFSTGGQAGTAIQEYNYNQYYGWNNPNYVEVWRYVGTAPSPAPAPSSQKSSAIDTFKNQYGGGFTLNHIKIDEIKFVNGLWQYVNYDLANGGQGKDKSFDWTNNGIPFGIGGFDPSKYKVGMTISPMISGTIDEYDIPSNGCGVNISPYGMIWFNADALLKRF